MYANKQSQNEKSQERACTGESDFEVMTSNANKESYGFLECEAFRACL